MPVTLAQAQQNALDDYDATVIDELRTNPLMDLITFDDVVNPAGGGATLTYGYRRVTTAPTADFRAINSEYTPHEAQTTPYSTTLKVLGGSYQIDRVLADIGPAASGEVAFQTSQKIKAVHALFGDTIINGDETNDPDQFDGLKVALAGSSTEDTNVHDWSGSMTQALAFKILTDVDDLLSTMDGQASALIGNRKTVQLIKAASRFANQYVERVGPRETALATYNGATLVDAGLKAGSAAEVIPTNSSGTANQTALYAVRMGLDGFHGVSVAGRRVVKAYLPDFNSAGAVKTGEVELGPIGAVLKATKAAAVFTKVKIA